MTERSRDILLEHVFLLLFIASFITIFIASASPNTSVYYQLEQYKLGMVAMASIFLFIWLILRVNTLYSLIITFVFFLIAYFII